MEGSWGIIHMLKSLQTQLQRRHRQRCLKIDTFIQGLIFPDSHFIASRINRKQCSGVILVDQVLRASATVLRYC